MNLATFSGNLGRDAKVGTAGSKNTPYISFPLGVSKGYGENQSTIWIGVTLWGKRAEGKLPQYLGKGAKVVVSGEVGLDMYTKADNTQGATVTLRCTELELMDGRDNESIKEQAPASQPAPVQDDLDDDIPF